MDRRDPRKAMLSATFASFGQSLREASHGSSKSWPEASVFRKTKNAGRTTAASGAYAPPVCNAK
jgi:hypothetical protein